MEALLTTSQPLYGSAIVRLADGIYTIARLGGSVTIGRETTTECTLRPLCGPLPPHAWVVEAQLKGPTP